MKVSVIVPIYNVQKYVEKSLISIINQSFDNYEIIIVNDGSTDNSMDIVFPILKKSSIPYSIINQENSGLPSARNSGLLKALGEFVCFIDSDDILDEDFLRSQYNAVKSNDVLVSFCDFEHTTEKKRQGKNTKNDFTSIIERQALLKGFMTRKYKIHCCSLLINREFLIKNNILFDERLRFGEDVEFMWRLFPRLHAVAYISAPYYKYLLRNGSLMTSQKTDRVVILNKIYSKTISDMQLLYPGDEQIYNYMPARITLGCINSYAKQADYLNFKTLIDSLNYKVYTKQLYTFPDYKIRILSRLLDVSPVTFYKIINFQKAFKFYGKA